MQLDKTLVFIGRINNPDAPGFLFGDLAFVFSTKLAVAVGIGEDAARSKMTRLGSWDSRKVVNRCVMVCEFLL
jgi:hypothetical protein